MISSGILNTGINIYLNYFKSKKISSPWPPYPARGWMADSKSAGRYRGSVVVRGEGKDLHILNYFELGGDVCFRCVSPHPCLKSK